MNKPVAYVIVHNDTFDIFGQYDDRTFAEREAQRLNRLENNRKYYVCMMQREARDDDQE